MYFGTRKSVLKMNADTDGENIAWRKLFSEVKMLYCPHSSKRCLLPDSKSYILLKDIEKSLGATTLTQQTTV